MRRSCTSWAAWIQARRLIENNREKKNWTNQTNEENIKENVCTKAHSENYAMENCCSRMSLLKQIHFRENKSVFAVWFVSINQSGSDESSVLSLLPSKCGLFLLDSRTDIRLSACFSFHYQSLADPRQPAECSTALVKLGFLMCLVFTDISKAQEASVPAYVSNQQKKKKQPCRLKCASR